MHDRLHLSEINILYFGKVTSSRSKKEHFKSLKKLLKYLLHCAPPMTTHSDVSTGRSDHANCTLILQVFKKISNLTKYKIVLLMLVVLFLKIYIQMRLGLVTSAEITLPSPCYCQGQLINYCTSSEAAIEKL